MWNEKLWNWFYLRSEGCQPTEKWIFPLHNLICEQEKGNWAKCKNIPINLCKKEPVKKEWIKIFPVEFRSNFLLTAAAAAGLRWNVDDGELQSAPCSSSCFPDPRGFLREPQFPEGARTASSETSIHGPAVNLLWLSWGFLFCSSFCMCVTSGRNNHTRHVHWFNFSPLCWF